MSRTLLSHGITATVLILLFSAVVLAVPPSPEALEKWQAEGILEQKLQNWRSVDSFDPNLSDHRVFSPDKFRAKTAQAAVDTHYVVVVLVDFDDMPHTESASEFDSLLFSVTGQDQKVNATGSWTDFYMENSYGKFFVKGLISGWHRMDSLYSWYVGQHDGDNADWLAYHAALASDQDIDYRAITEGFAFYGFIVVHAGAGAEAGAYGIWSHHGGMPTATLDGVNIYDYAMNPEKYSGGISTMGVFAHEYGHSLGLIDLYDIDYTPAGSSGLGDWSLMAGGSWNGFQRGGDTPSHFDAWSKWVLGFVQPTLLQFKDNKAQSIIQAEIPQIESEPVVYKLENDAMWQEYWLVENRQRVGFDRALSGAGLCIYHIDVNRSNNSTPGLYKVALEQADGLDALAFGGPGTEGDAGDPYPGSTNNRDFHNLSTPNSRTHLGEVSQIGVWRISDSDSLMYADLEAGYTHPWPVYYSVDPIQFSDPAPGGDGDGLLEPGERIEFRCRLTNTMGKSFDPWVHLSVDHPDIVFDTADAMLGFISFNPLAVYQENQLPIVFHIPETTDPANVTFTLTLTSDNACCGSSENHYVSTWEIPETLGKAKILLVDDDGGKGWDTLYTATLQELGYAYNRWDKASTGSPSSSDLANYEIVIWATGHPTTGGVFQNADIAAMTGYLAGGGNLAISSIGGAQRINSLAPTFLPDYMHANYVSAGQFATSITGVTGGAIGDGLSVKYDGGFSFPASHNKLTAAVGGQEEFSMVFTGPVGLCGVSYSGAYKTVLLTFQMEFINDNESGYATKAMLLARIVNFFDGTATAVIEDDHSGLPSSFTLEQNYPNPFNPSTTISYTVAAGSGPVRIKLEVFNVLGQEVATLVDKVQPVGNYEIEWDGCDGRGHQLASGIYLYRLSQGRQTETKKMMLLK